MVQFRFYFLLLVSLGFTVVLTISWYIIESLCFIQESSEASNFFNVFFFF